MAWKNLTEDVQAEFDSYQDILLANAEADFLQGIAVRRDPYCACGKEREWMCELCPACGAAHRAQALAKHEETKRTIRRNTILPMENLWASS